MSDPVRRSWRRAVGIAIGVVYLPQLTPFAVGPLTECDHCIAEYWRMFAILPGIYGRTVLGQAQEALGGEAPPIGDFLDTAQGWALVIGLTIVALAACAAVARRRGRIPVGILTLLAVWSGFVSVGFSHLLRM